MARSTRPSPLRPTTERVARLVALVLAVPLLAVLPAAAASGQEATPPPALGAVLDGEVDGLTATATSAFGGGADRPEMEVTIEVTNLGSEPASVAVPFGLLLATEEESDQTVAVAGPTDDPTLVEVAASGGTPELPAPPGTSTHMLTVYCAEMDDGAPLTPTPMHHAGTAADPLPTVLRNIAAQAPSEAAAQDAVWWVTDHPSVVVPSHIAPLLDGVDTEAFAAAPHAVVPDSAYVPTWKRSGVLDEAFDGGTQATATSPSPSGGGAGPLLWILLAAGAFTLALIVLARRSSPSPAPAPVTSRTGGPAGPGAPGWYPDPWVAGGVRWWDGRTWTSRVGPGR